jgi:class 3 adenylate cyclase/tetratricopeptide (TPR) repeat protein
MRCPQCHFENRAAVKFCEECGTRIRQVCPHCGLEVPMGRKFCGECGLPLPAAWATEGMPPAMVGERKRITVLFSDLSGYTRMTERMDPEEVKEIMDRIFAEITTIVRQYDGSIGRFLGDAAMILFGVPSSHEDDAVRAILTAREIHSAVEALSPTYQTRIGHPLAMHTGIDSGLVVISELDSGKAADEITGDTVNLASRLCSLARAGTILVGPETYRLAQAYFVFERGEPAELKGKSEPIEPYEVLAARDKPDKDSRLHGLQAELIGRAAEMALLADAVERLQEGKRTVFCISGDPGTGKTRLVEEFLATLNRQRFGWMTAHAYGYTQNMPYSPLIEFLNWFWKIEEGDTPESIRRKIEMGVHSLLGPASGVCSILGSLYALDSPERERMSPELWKAELFEAINRLLEAYARSKPIVICLEDLHWADPPFVDLIRFLLSGSTFPALFLCLYRPPFKLLTTEQLTTTDGSFQEIHLQDLSSAEAQQMMESLLRTKTIPGELRPFIHEKTEGNPFYLEEVINSLIESETLVQDHASWKLTRVLSEAGISPTIHGVIAARLDRLSLETKKILQEASVIGRNFLYVILEHISDLKERLQDGLSGLERLDLIRTKAIQPELEYIFKHALTQEVVYNGLLKKERQVVHERIGQVVEFLFRDRLPEIYETLAFHFKQGKSVYKAVDYLVKSGEKSLRRYAVEESHQYFREAYQLLTEKGINSAGDKELLIDLLIKWGFVYYYSGEYRKLHELLEAHRELAETLTDKSRLGMFYAWLSCPIWHREKPNEAFAILSLALRLGEEAGNPQVMGYAYTWLTWTCMELGRLNEAAIFAEKAQKLCQSGDIDPFIYFNSLGGLAYVHFYRGERRKAFEAGKTLLDFGNTHSNIRSMVMGYCFMGYSHLAGGDMAASSACFEEAVRISVDPWYRQFPSLALCYARIIHGEYQGLLETLEGIIRFSEERGVEYVGTPARLLSGAVLAAQGQLGRGVKVLEEVADIWLQSGNRLRYAVSQLILGRVYALMAQGSGKKNLAMFFRNIGFLIKTVPFADRKALVCLRRAIEVANEIGAKDTSARAHLALGLLHKAKRRPAEARECLACAVQLFEECEADACLAEAREGLRSLD